jgi:4-hydroxybenzoate polyprenyltransferase
MKKIFEYIEKSNFTNALIIALISPIIRGVLEGAIDHNKMLTNPIEYKSFLFIFFHQYAFYFAVYLALAFLIRLFYKKDRIEILTFIFSTSIIIITPPIIDAIFGGNFRPSYIFKFDEFIYSLLNVFNPFVELRALSPGMRFEIFLAVIGIFLWTLSIEKHFIKSILIIILFLTIVALIGSMPGFISKIYFDSFSLIETDTQRYTLLNLYILTIFLILTFPEYTFKILKMRIYKFLYYLPLLIFGFFIGIKVVKWTYFRAFENIFDYLGIFNIIISLFLAFLIALIINDYYDREIDKINNKKNVFNEGILKENEFLPFVIVLFVLCVFFSISASYSVFIVLSVIISSAIIYSIEPIRLKRFWILSTLNLSFIALMSIVIGISYFYKENPILILNEKIILSVLIGITLGFGIKDLSDVEGDKKGFIFTAYTLFGNFGKFIQGILTSSTFLIISKILEINILVGFLFFIVCFIFSIQKKFYEFLFLLLFSIFSIICFYKIYQSDKFFNEVSYNYHALELMKFSDLKPLEKKVNDILNYEFCNRNMREIQALLYYDLKQYEKLDSLMNFISNRCYLNGRLYHIWSLALFKLKKYHLAIEKAKIATLLLETGAYWTLSAMYYILKDNFKSLHYQNIAIKKKASDKLAWTLFNP